MEKSSIKKINKLISAYCQGKIIQRLFKNMENGKLVCKWQDYKDFRNTSIQAILRELECFRVKPEAKYEPFTNAREFISALKEHGDLIVVGSEYYNPTHINDDGISCRNATYKVDEIYTYETLLKKLIFLDETPCGKKVEQYEG